MIRPTLPNSRTISSRRPSFTFSRTESSERLEIDWNIESRGNNTLGFSVFTVISWHKEKVRVHRVIDEKASTTEAQRSRRKFKILRAPPKSRAGALSYSRFRWRLTFFEIGEIYCGR